MNTALVVFVSCFHILQNFFLIIGYQLVQSSALANKSMLLFFLLCIDTVLTVECYTDEQTNKKQGCKAGTQPGSGFGGANHELPYGGWVGLRVFRVYFL